MPAVPNLWRPAFAPSGDGQLAYLLDDGDGTVVVSHSGTAASSITAAEPLFQPLYERWRKFGRLLLIDPRGSGSSDPLPPSVSPSVELAANDLFAVLDHAEVEKAWIHGNHAGVLVAIAAATARPERVHGLLLANGWARLLIADDIPWGITKEFSDALIREHGRQFGTGMFAPLMAPSRSGDPEAEQLFVKMERGSSRSQAMLLTTMVQEADVRSLLPKVSVPTIVVHVRDNALVPVQHGRYLAAHIPGAKYVELDGTDHVFIFENTDEVMDEFESFVTGQRPQPRTDRVFATVLFTDIVGSTEQAGRIGDHRWRGRLDAHDRTAAEVVTRRGGAVVKHTGDGVLAIFEAPTRALRAGLDLVARLKADGISVRAGAHAGEIERRGDDVSGIAVHVAQRVCGIAAGGELLVSRGVPDLVLGESFTFTDAGEHTLKGVAGRWQLLRVEP